MIFTPQSAPVPNARLINEGEYVYSIEVYCIKVRWAIMRYGTQQSFCENS